MWTFVRWFIFIWGPQIINTEFYCLVLISQRNMYNSIFWLPNLADTGHCNLKMSPDTIGDILNWYSRWTGNTDQISRDLIVISLNNTVSLGKRVRERETSDKPHVILNDFCIYQLSWCLLLSQIAAAPFFHPSSLQGTVNFDRHETQTFHSEPPASTVAILPIFTFVSTIIPCAHSWYLLFTIILYRIEQRIAYKVKS